MGLTFQLGAPLFVTLLLLGLWVAAVGALCVVPHSPPTFSFEKVFHVPGFPVVPALGILVNTHLFCSLGWATQAQFAVWTLIGLATYVLYSVKSAAEADESSLDRYALVLCVSTTPDDRLHAQCGGGKMLARQRHPTSHRHPCRHESDSGIQFVPLAQT